MSVDLNARRKKLASVRRAASTCTRCALSEIRTQVVFGAGNPDANLMFVGEAPGAEEDRLGQPFVGRSGNLLTALLSDVGIDREEVFIVNTVKCRPPDNRNPSRHEIETCRPWLFEQIELIEPEIVATLGNFSTRLLTGSQDGITKVHGVPRAVKLGSRTVQLMPLFHPAAALRSTGVKEQLAADLAKLPGMLGMEAHDV